MASKQQKMLLKLPSTPVTTTVHQVRLLQFQMLVWEQRHTAHTTQRNDQALSELLHLLV